MSDREIPKRGDASQTIGETLRKVPQTAASAGLATALWSREVTHDGLALSTLLDSIAEGHTDIPTAEESFARFARYQEAIREYEEWLAALRKQAPQHIRARHIKHARSRLDWATVVDAQYPTPALRRNAEHTREDGRLAEIVKQRESLAKELRNRVEEPEIQERATAELLAYIWAEYAARHDDTDTPVDDILRDYLPTPEDWQVVAETRLDIEALERILDITPKRRPNLASPALPFDDAGRGFLPSHNGYRAIAQGLGRFEQWQHKSGDYPEYRLPGKYGIFGDMSIAGGNALRIWEGIKSKAKQAKQHGDILPDVYIVIAATIHTHRSRLDLFGNGRPYIALDSLMHDLGIRKHDRKYNLEDIEKVSSAIAAIGDIRVRGTRRAYPEKGKPIDVPFQGPIWQVIETIPKVYSQRALDLFLSGDRGEFTNDAGDIPPQSIAGWTLALSAGLLAAEDELPQEARVMRALMSYPPVHGRFRRRLGYSLSCEFRIRYRDQNWAQPYTVRDVLEDAALAVDTKDPRRTYKAFHEALQQLQKDGIIGTVRYIRPPRGRQPFDPGYNTGRKGWLETWLSARIVIMPPADVEAAYRDALAANQPRRRKPKALNG